MKKYITICIFWLTFPFNMALSFSKLKEWPVSPNSGEMAGFSYDYH